MCGPALLAVATFTMGVAQSVAQYQGQKATYKANRDAAIVENENAQRQLTLRQMQEQDATSQRKQAAVLEGAEKQAEAQVAGAAAGVAGLSLDSIVGDIGRRTGLNVSTLDQNYRMTADQLQQEKDSATAKAEGRINSVAKPSAFGLVAGIGTSALDGFSTYSKNGGTYGAA